MEGSPKMQTGSDVLNMWITASIKASDVCVCKNCTRYRYTRTIATGI